MDRTVFYDANFLQLLIRCGGNSCTYILAMPKGCFDDEKIPIWGSDRINSEANYVLPKYIYGMIDGSGKKRKFIKNQILDLKEYKYLYCDRENEPINLSNNKQK